MKNIFFALNTLLDSYLTSQVKNYLSKNNIDYNIDIYEFNLRELKEFNYLNNKSIYLNNNYETWYDFNLIDYINLLKVIRNYNQNIDLLTDLEISDLYYNHLKYLINYFQNLKEYDLYCFSIYQQYLLDYFICSLTLFQKNKNSHILFGGPEIILMDSIRELCNRFNISTSIGDVETSVYRAITEEKKLDYTSYLDLSKLTKEDIPLFDNQILKASEYKITLNTSRGCPNNCYYCSGSKLSPYRFINRDIIISWIRYYNYHTNIKGIYINDNNFGIIKLDYVLDELKRFNKISLLVELELNHLTDNVISKLNKAGIVSENYGLECIHPKMQKLMNKKLPIMNRILKCFKYIQGGKMYYIYGLPGQDEIIFNEELDFLKKLKEVNPKIRIETIPYYLSPKSYIEQNKSKFKIKIISTLEEEAKKIIPEHIDIFKRIYNKYDFPERKNIFKYKETIDEQQIF